MAVWKTFRQSSGNIVLLYENTFTHEVEKLGTMRADVTPEVIVDWILANGGPGMRDIIILHDGRTLQLVRAGDG